MTPARGFTLQKVGEALNMRPLEIKQLQDNVKPYGQSCHCCWSIAELFNQYFKETETHWEVAQSFLTRKLKLANVQIPEKMPGDLPKIRTIEELAEFFLNYEIAHSTLDNELFFAPWTDDQWQSMTKDMDTMNIRQWLGLPQA